MRLLIVEEALRDLKAHWFGYIQTISDGVEKEGWEVEVACHQDVNAEIKEKLKCFPVFQFSRYLDDSERKLTIERLLSPLLHSFRMFKALRPLLKRKNYDMVFAPTVLLHHLLAWWAVTIFYPKRVGKLTLFFVTNPGIWNNTEKRVDMPRSAIFLKLCLKLFAQPVKNGKVKLAVETKGAKREFEQVSGLPFVLMPHPVPMPDIETRSQNKTEENTIHFACYGFARHEKGSDLFKQAVEELIKQDNVKGLNFTIQWTDPFLKPDGSLCMPGQVLEESPDVTIIDRPVDQEEYQQLLMKTDCMVLPYRNSSYHARLSRVVIEAVCQGIPMIYTRGGWIEDTVQKYGAGIGIEDESVDGLVNAILGFQENKRELLSIAGDRRAKARGYYSAQNFCQKLLAYT